jgi:hypothetical protein
MWCLVQSAKPSLHSNVFCGILHMHVGLIWIFQETLCKVVFDLLNAYFQKSACFTDVTSATITWDAVHTLIRLPDISNWSSFDHCTTECMFSLENDSEIETVPDSSEFLTLDIRDNDSALVFCFRTRTISC